MIRRTVRNNHRWKVIELELVHDIEKRLGQKIAHKMILNASTSMDFSVQANFLLWLAFTPEYIVFVHRDKMVYDGKGDIMISRKRDTSVKQLKKRYAEICFKQPGEHEPVHIVVLAREYDYESLKRNLKN